MPLSERQKHLLHEIYEVFYSSRIVTTSGLGYISTPTIFDDYSSIKSQLTESIENISRDESKVARIAEILEEYDNIALDYSTIDREGYSMQPQRNLRRIHLALQPYTGIIFNKTTIDSRIQLG